MTQRAFVAAPLRTEKVIFRARAFAYLISIALPGCGSMSIEVETLAAPTAAPANLQTVMVAPLVNRSENPGAPAAIGSILARALVAHTGWRIVDAPAGVAVDPEKLDRAQARELSKLSGADAILTGIIFAYGYVPAGQAPKQPAVRLDLRLVSGVEPEVLWAARASAFDSSGACNPGASLTAMADAVVRRLIDDLASRR